MPSRMIIEENCIMKRGQSFSELGKRCLVVTGGSAAARSGALADVEAVLEAQQIDSVVYSDIAQNPTVASCIEGGRRAHAFGAEFVIGIGGGSPLDAAKAITVFAANPEMTEAEFYSAKWGKNPLPSILIGTTAGTGSEVTSVSVLTDSAGRKHSIHDDRLYAKIALGDARYTMTLPRSVTLSTGIDVIAHCVESYFNKKADRISQMFAAEGVKLGLPLLQAAVSGTELSPKQREGLYQASILGGMAINRTGTVFPHNVGYYLTEHYSIPHGFASAVFMPELLEHVKQCAPEQYTSFFQETGTGEEELCDLIQKAVPQKGIFLTEDEIQAALPRWEKNNSVQNTLGTVTLDQIAAMLRKQF